MIANPQLPIDPDVGQARISTLLRHANIGLVVLGGAIGTLVRQLVSGAFPHSSDFPIHIFLINIVGAFFLGFLLESLLRPGPETAQPRRIRLLLGTGFAGGFTTYSALAVDAAELLHLGEVWTGVGYGLATVVVGGGATVLGIVLGTKLQKGRSEPDSSGTATDGPIVT